MGAGSNKELASVLNKRDATIGKLRARLSGLQDLVQEQQIQLGAFEGNGRYSALPLNRWSDAAQRQVERLAELDKSCRDVRRSLDSTSHLNYEAGACFVNRNDS